VRQQDTRQTSEILIERQRQIDKSQEKQQYDEEKYKEEVERYDPQNVAD